MKTTAYYNGKVYTMREEGETVSAFVCRDGKFVYCGSDEQAKAMADECVDLEGAAVLPGFIDTHVHVIPAGIFMKGADLSKAKTVSDVLDQLRENAGKTYRDAVEAYRTL